MLIVVTTSDGKNIDLHFGACKKFYVYNENAGFSEIREYGHTVDWHSGEGVKEVTALLSGCSYVLTAKIGGKPHSILKNAGITALEAPAGIADAINKVAAYHNKYNKDLQSG
jgi:predicted Fe-Mo cluster-binding NifX family protein